MVGPSYPMSKITMFANVVPIIRQPFPIVVIAEGNPTLLSEQIRLILASLLWSIDDTVRS